MSDFEFCQCTESLIRCDSRGCICELCGLPEDTRFHLPGGSYEQALSAAQQKIAELEAALANLQLRYECNTAIMHARTKTLTAVRQRCEEAEAAVRPFKDALQAAYANGVLSPDDKSEDRIYVGHSLLRAALAHFTRYPTASDSEERGG